MPKPSFSVPEWISALTVEDAAFVKRFVLASGSLKQLAKDYGISYPTVRLRLDRLIEKIKIHDSSRECGPMERHLLMLYADGRLDLETVRSIMKFYERNRSEQTLGETESSPGQESC